MILELCGAFVLVVYFSIEKSCFASAERRVSSRELESTPKGRGGHVLVVLKFLGWRSLHQEGKFILHHKRIIVKSFCHTSCSVMSICGCCTRYTIFKKEW